jgi:hypothetical protein
MVLTQRHGFPVNITKRRPALHSGSMVPRIDTNPFIPEDQSQYRRHRAFSRRRCGHRCAPLLRAHRKREIHAATTSATPEHRGDAGALINAGIPDFPRSS